MEAIAAASDHSVSAIGSEPNGIRSITTLLRIKQQMSTQFFEIEKNKGECSLPEAKRDMPGLISEIERVSTDYFNNTLLLHRMQLCHAIANKLEHNDAQASQIKELSKRCMAMCSRIKHVQNENRDLKNEIAKIQKERYDLWQITAEKRKEIDVMLKEEYPEAKQYKAWLAEVKTNLESCKRMITLTQNVLRGIFLAFKVNWLDDPKLKDIVMNMEAFPYLGIKEVDLVSQ
ncbi:centromere protein H isoform X2 [Cynoglossus semilaevis]|uniref:centromere protein H isoform X2 n=1 Tax=Cynoglossus semilaevis TaxID=244447 RepID=UPI00049796D4|nr:centromere protein H isoform X2 [Cynoglossus semilaevis]